MSMGINSNLHVEFRDNGKPDSLQQAMGKDIYDSVSYDEGCGAGSFVAIDNKEGDLDPREGKVVSSRNGYFTEVLYNTETGRIKESYTKGFDQQEAIGMESHVKWDNEGKIGILMERRELPDHIQVLEMRHNRALGIITVDEKILTYDEIDHPATAAVG